MGRRCNAGLFSVAILQKPRNMFRLKPALADIHQCAHHNPHHVFQKAFSNHINDNLIARGRNGNGIDPADRCLCNTIRGPESGKVMSADKPVRGIPHNRQIERLADMPGVKTMQWRAYS